MLRSYRARRTSKELSQGFIHSCWIKCANLMSRKQYSQSIYVLWQQISHIDSLIKNIKKVDKSQKIWKIKLAFFFSSSPAQPCQERYPEENPATLESLCQLNRFQTSGAEICRCAQWMKYSVGGCELDVPWAAEIMNYKEYTKCFFLVPRLPFSLPPKCSGGVIWLNVLTYNLLHFPLTAADSSREKNLLWLVQI